MLQRITCLIFIFLVWNGLPASGQLVLQQDSLINLIVDGDFDQPCLEEEIYVPYNFESEGHNNSPDMVVFREDSTGGKWYWDEFGCLKDRYFLPFLPLHYACCHTRQEPPVPPAYSGKGYACLIREPQVNEALVYKLKGPIHPGQPYRVSFAARAMSPFCPRPSIRVSVSATEPCQRKVNSLTDQETTTCWRGLSFTPTTIFESDTLGMAWTSFEQILIAPDTLKWIIFSPGPVDTTDGLTYLGIDDIQVNLLPIPTSLTAPVHQHRFGEEQQWTLTFQNPYALAINQYPIIVYTDDKLALLNCPRMDTTFTDGGIRVLVDIPAGTSKHPTEVQTTFTWRCLSECPLRSQLVVGQIAGDLWPYRLEIKQPDPSPIVYIPDSTLSLTAAIEKGLLPADSIQGQEIFLNGDFLLNASTYRFVDCLIRVRWGSQLIIPPDRSISLIRTEFQGCGQPWESIHIMKDGAIYLEDSLIREAKTALLCRPGSFIRMRGSDLHGTEMDMEVEIDDSNMNIDKSNKRNKTQHDK
ncbi:MAG: hypothetical protein K9I85_10400 [Saprospiraceae bacterium]|nr:hypothetical protein [Saprospiraceae bacterium]